MHIALEGRAIPGKILGSALRAVVYLEHLSPILNLLADPILRPIAAGCLSPLIPPAVIALIATLVVLPLPLILGVLGGLAR